MDENVVLNSEQSEQNTTNVTQEVQADSEVNNENIENSNDIMLADYYDGYYYQNVLDKLNSIDTHQSEIILNQNTIIEQQQNQTAILTTHTLYFEVIIFLIALVFISDVFRNMIKKI